MQQAYNYTRGFRIFLLCLLAPFVLMVPFTFYFLSNRGINATYYLLTTFLSPLFLSWIVFALDDLFSVIRTDNDVSVLKV